MEAVTGTQIGSWRKPPCYFCKRPIAATADHTRAPMYIRMARAWSCRACWDARRTRPNRVRPRDGVRPGTLWCGWEAR